MVNRNLITCFFLILVIAVSASGQDNAKTAPQKTLKEAYSGKFLIGAANDLTSISEAESANIIMHYNIITPENCMKPQPIHPAEDTYNFVTADAMVEWCQKNGLKIWGHTLAWHSQSPQWFFQEKNPAAGEAAKPATPPSATTDPNAPRPNMAGPGGRDNTGPQASREVVLERLKNHIMTVVGRYKGRIKGWDVFNESIADGGDGKTENLRTSSWYKAVGPDVITLAFKWAHEADPNAILILNGDRNDSPRSAEARQNIEKTYQVVK